MESQNKNADKTIENNNLASNTVEISNTKWNAVPK